MTPYEQKVTRIKELYFANEGQIEVVIKTRRFIDDNFANDLRLEFLAQNCFLSKYHLQRLFKRYYGLSPKQYLIDKRIEKSKEKLRKGLSVRETCLAVGFASLGSFSQLFKTKTGRSPSEFRKEQVS
ncbi:MAG: AraC family transcriptional regulator, partial [Bacteroidota bacterium]